MSEISEIIKGERKKLRLTQTEFANRIKIRQNALSLIESGKLNVSIDILTVIINEFGLDPNVFFKVFKHGLISENINAYPVKGIIQNIDNSKISFLNVSSTRLEEIIQYKLHYIEYYILGILDHAREINENINGIKRDDKKVFIETAYIKRFTDNPSVYLNYTVEQKFDLIIELDEAITQYLDNIWSITMTLI